MNSLTNSAINVPAQNLMVNAVPFEGNTFQRRAEPPNVSAADKAKVDEIYRKMEKKEISEEDGRKQLEVIAASYGVSFGKRADPAGPTPEETKRILELKVQAERKLSKADQSKIVEIGQEVTDGKLTAKQGIEKMEAILNGSEPSGAQPSGAEPSGAASISFSFMVIASLALSSFLISA